MFLELTDQLQQEGRLTIVTDTYNSNASVKDTDTPSGNEEEQTVAHYANSAIDDTIILMDRALLNILRTKEHFFARLGASVFFGVQMGTLFLFTAMNHSG